MNESSVALNRFGLGARPDGAPPADPRGWLLAQLDRYDPRPAPVAALASTADIARRVADGRAAVNAAPEDRRRDAKAALKLDNRDDYADAVAARAAVALTTDTPFVERLAQFWSNHFAVSVDKNYVLPFAGAFEAEAIRPHVLGRFADLLAAAERHPAMLFYLDQANSIGPDSRRGLGLAERRPDAKRGLNENLAREILELHTLGARSGYTQDDVVELARALTGWTVGGMAARGNARRGTPGAFAFFEAVHEPGERTVLGRRYPAGGEAQGMAILADLAVAPATADHIATKLARHFVADDPPAAVVQRLRAAFLSSGGDLPTVYRALVESPEAWAPAPAKFKSPWEWLVSVGRGLGWKAADAGRATGLLKQLGQPVWSPGSPAGWPDTAAGWAAPDALVRRVEVAQSLSQAAGDGADPRALGPRLLPGGPGEATVQAVARAESPAAGLALLFVSPEFLRR